MQNKLIVALVSGALLCAMPANAELTSGALKKYNEAVTANDGEAIIATAKQLVKEAISDPENPNSTVAAYEAALKLCERDECAAALPGAEFVVAQPATNAHPIMSDRQLLKAYAEYKVESTSETREGLETALLNVKSNEPSYLSLRAFIQLADAYYSGADWAKALDVSSVAVEHLEVVKTNVPDVYFLAREIEAISGFIQRRGSESHERLIRLSSELGQLRYDVNAGGKDIPEWMEETYWRAEAWVFAAKAVFETYDKKGSLGNFRATELKEKGLTDSEIKAIQDEYPKYKPWRTLRNRRTEPMLPPCAGELIKSPDIRFPIHKGIRGLMGSVIIRMDFDEEGNVIDPKVLAAVPVDGFEEDVIRAVSKWRWKKSPDEDRECRMDRNEYIMAVRFLLG